MSERYFWREPADALDVAILAFPNPTASGGTNCFGYWAPTSGERVIQEQSGRGLEGATLDEGDYLYKETKAEHETETDLVLDNYLTHRA